jgi:hypothetical protein
MESLLNFYNVKVADMDEDLFGIGDLEARKFCENSNLQFDFRILSFYMKALLGVSRNDYSRMIVCKSHFDEDVNSQYLGFLHGHINYRNSKDSQFMLNGFYVSPNFRESGVGRSLLIGLEECLSQTDVAKIFSCLDNNSDGFLMRCGFAMGGRGADVYKYINSRKGQFGDKF